MCPCDCPGCQRELRNAARQMLVHLVQSGENVIATCQDIDQARALMAAIEHEASTMRLPETRS